ncbi:MAG: oxidoreductase [Eggerthellaceae bacterium]|nr:oxidoreductase [Eggerthellaceae bacterium]
MTKAILVNTEFCTGCHSCEVSCKLHLDLPKGEYGIKLGEVGPFQYTVTDLAGKWEWTYQPVLTQACDMCAERTEIGKMPLCVQHCQAWCMYYGEAEDLVKKMDGQTRWALLTTKD